jgi:hypothetical protein
MAASRPAGALLEALDEERVVRATNQNRVPAHLLEVTFETEIGIAGGEEFGVDRAVGSMANSAPFAESLVFEHMRAAPRRGTGSRRRWPERRSAATVMDRTLVQRMAVRCSELSGAG